ncbi:MAG: DNA translocase FtsK [Lachnospiraceae bacterium]|nr:DNA translocase FtsK [Lachnospiraceae bacterium]
MEPALKKELVILVSLAVCILLFCSNLHWCGSFGEAIYHGLRGLFGIFGYLMPIYLFLAVCFLLSNEGSTRAVIRVLVSALVLMVFCGLASLLAISEFDSAVTLKDYYTQATESLSGGFFGGLCLKLLYPSLGMVGAYVVLILLAMAGIVVTTQKSLLGPLQKGGKKVYDTAKEDMIRRHEIWAEKAEERKKYRTDKKVRGVSLNTDIIEEDIQEFSQDAGEEEPEKEEDIFRGEIHGMVDAYETEEEDFMSGENTKPLQASKVEHTLSELDAMIEKTGGKTEKEDPGIKLYHIPPVEDEIPAWEEAEVSETESVEADGFSEAAFFPEEETLPVTSGEVRRIVTAGGKVIEVEEDPTEPDPITEKRMMAGKEQGEHGSIFREEGSGRGNSGSVRFTDISLAGRTQRETAEVERKNQPERRPEPKRPPRPYRKPPVTLLKQGDRKIKNRDSELKETAVKLQQTLRNFGVGVTVTNISCGPSVTRYELTPEQGVKVSRIVSLTDDIKLNLAAADIRIEAPIPGKAAVGIEVPNRENMTVAFRDVIESEEFRTFPSKLAFAVGRDIAGQTVVADMARMPHLLIAGATGSGKSVCINTLIMSILYKAEPSEVKLIMIDPKVVELSVYNGIPHLMIPVVTDPKKAAGALNWAVAEMTDRYKKFAEFNVRDLKGYNAKLKEEEGETASPLPHLVIIVDELSDLMMVAPGEVEDAICRLAQMARAAGIHLVLATQRPSVNVITGLIKANVPSRIAFSVSSGVDSRTIIDMNGAEKLLGKGDMLFYPSGYQKPVRVQGAFISDGEVSEVVKFLTENTDTQYSQEVENRLSIASAPDSAGGGDRDAYFADAGRFLIEKEKGSIGMIQRAFKVGFNRAARIMDQLAEAGVVGDEEGTKPRKVLMTMEEFEELLEK